MRAFLRKTGMLFGKTRPSVAIANLRERYESPRQMIIDVQNWVDYLDDEKPSPEKKRAMMALAIAANELAHDKKERT